MTLDNQLRSAAADVRSELASAEPPPFRPPAPTGSRIGLLAVVMLVVGGGWWATRSPHDTPPLVDATVDSTASTAISRITNSESGAVIQPVFSATQTHNADGSLLLLYRTGDDDAVKGHVVLDAVTGEVVSEPDFTGRSDIENIAWDPLDADTLIFQRGNELVDVHARTGQETASIAFPECSSIGNGSSAGSNISQTGVVGLLCAGTDGVDRWMAFDRSGERTIVGDVASITAAPIPSISGTRFVVAAADTLLVFDADLGLTDTVEIETSALVMAQDRDGNDLAVTTVFGGPTGVGTIVTVDLATAAVDVIVGPETGYPYPPSGTQLSTAATNAPYRVAISTNTDADGELANEIMLIDLDGSASTLFRLAQHRNDGEPVGGWDSTTMVAVSPDGDRVLFSSNWGDDAIDTYEITPPS